MLEKWQVYHYFSNDRLLLVYALVHYYYTLNLLISTPHRCFTAGKTVDCSLLVVYLTVQQPS